MSDNGRLRRGGELFGAASGVGLVGVVTWIGTKHQVRPHESYAQGPIHVRSQDDMGTSEAAPATMLLAQPPAWMQRDDLPCTRTVPTCNGKDPYDTNNKGTARKLCAGCPVIEECLADALAFEKGLGPRSRYLVRGGLLPVDRAALDGTGPTD